MCVPLSESIPSRFVTFHRRVLNDDSTSMFEDLSTSTIPLGSVEFHPTGSIEEATHALQADFANKYIGKDTQQRDTHTHHALLSLTFLIFIVCLSVSLPPSP